MGTIHLYNSIDNSHETIYGNGLIRELLPDVDFSKALIIKEGDRLNFENASIEDDDIVFVRTMPGSTVAIATIAIVTAVVAIGVGVGSAIYANKQSEEAKARYEKAQRDAQNLASTVDTLPFLKGAKNTSALGKSIQYLMGEMYNTPYLLTNGYYTLDGENGSKQYWTGILSLGFGEQLIKSVSVGTAKIKTLEETKPQSEIYSFDTGSDYYDSVNIIELAQKKDLTLDYFNKKVVAVADGSQIKHEYGKDAEPVIRQLASNTKIIELAIQLNGLRQYNTDTSSWQDRTITVNPYWSNDGGQTWNLFYFNFPQNQHEELASSAEVQHLINTGVITVYYSWEEKGSMYRSGRAHWNSNSPDYRINKTYFDGTTNCSQELDYSGNPRGQVRYDLPSVFKKIVSQDNQLMMNTRNTIRFTATKELTWADTHDENGNALDISIKIEKATPNLSGNSNEDVYLLYYNSFCYDAQKSNEVDGLIDCKPLEDWYTSKTTLMGIRLVANETTKDILDEINVISCGVARTWDRETKTWSTEKSATRNPASWLLEVMTSDIHKHSQYTDDELDLLSFGELYEYCEDNEYYTDALLTRATKKNDIISGILRTVNADMHLNTVTGKRYVVIDKKEVNPVALLNAQSIQSVTTAKSFERKPDGIKVTFTNRNSWAVDTFYSMLDGDTTHDEEDVLTELALDYVTTYEHAYKLAQRQMRQQKLQPREIKVKVGREGDWYPVYSIVKLQLEQLKIGIRSAIIHKVGVYRGSIVYLEISDWVQFETNKRYGAIIQAETNQGRKIYSVEVIGEGKTRRLELVTPISTNTDDVLPVAFNTLSFGEINDDGNFEKVTNLMKITAIDRSDNNGIELTLKDYNEAIYEYGEIPEYKTNLTATPNATQNKVTDLRFKEQTAELKSEIERDLHVQAQPIIQISDITTAEGFEEDTIGLYEDKFYKVINNKWVAIESNQYLGMLSEFPSDVSMGSFFALKNNVEKIFYISTNNKTLAVNNNGLKPLGIKQVYYKNKLFVMTSNGWEEIKDNSDYRYIIAMNDIVSNGGTLPFYVASGVAGATPKYLGASTEAPATAKRGDWFTYKGAEAVAQTDEEEKADQTETEFEKGKVYSYEMNSDGSMGWKEDSNSGHKMQALDDLLAMAEEEGGEHFASAFIEKLVSNNAFIKNLAAKIITLTQGGIIKSNNYNGTIDSNGNIIKYGDKGWAIDFNGKSDFVDLNATSGHFKGFIDCDVFKVLSEASYVPEIQFNIGDDFRNFYNEYFYFQFINEIGNGINKTVEEVFGQNKLCFSNGLKIVSFYARTTETSNPTSILRGFYEDGTETLIYRYNPSVIGDDSSCKVEFSKGENIYHTVFSVRNLPKTNPHNNGEVWNNNGVLYVSQG